MAPLKDGNHIVGTFENPVWAFKLGGKQEHFELCAEGIVRWLDTYKQKPPGSIQEMEKFVDEYYARFRPDLLAQLPNRTCTGLFWKIQLFAKGVWMRGVFMADSSDRIADGFEVLMCLN